jgi:hypothetical protein
LNRFHRIERGQRRALRNRPAAFAAFHQFPQGSVQPIKERRLQHESRHDILAGHGKVAVRQFIRMERAEVVDAVGVCIAYRPHLRTEVGVVLRANIVPHAKQLHDVIDRRTIAPLNGRELPPSTQHRLHHRRIVVFHVDESEAVRRVGIRFAVDMRHAVIVTDNGHLVFHAPGDGCLAIKS